MSDTENKDTSTKTETPTKDTSTEDKKDDTSSSDEKKDSNTTEVKKDTESTDKKDEDKKDSSDTSSSSSSSSDSSDSKTTGIVMNWNLVPVEQQVPQINWKQDINSDDKPLSKLASYQCGASNLGSNGLLGCSLTKGSASSYMEKNYEEFKANADKVSGLPDETSVTNKIDDFLAQMATFNYQLDLESACSSIGADAVLIASLMLVESGGYPEAYNGSSGSAGLMQLNPDYFSYRNTSNGSQDVTICHNDAVKNIQEGVPYLMNQVPSEQGVSNICCICSGYNYGPKNFIDSLEKSGDDNSSSSTKAKAKSTDSSSSSSTSSSKPTITADTTWCDLYPYMDKIPTETKQYFPKIVYAYHTLATKINEKTNMDSPDGPCFPIQNADFEKAYYIKKFGVQNQNSGVTLVSDGITIQVPEGTSVLLAETASITKGEDKDGLKGKYLTAKIKSDKLDNYEITYCNLKSYETGEKACDSEYYKKGCVIAKSGTYNKKTILTVIVKNAKGEVIDPTGSEFWAKLAGAYDENGKKSLKDFSFSS
jgi:hypothetical protein